jgi:putative transposase
MKAYVYRIYPNKKQVAILESWQTALLEVYRLCCIQRRIALARKNKGFKKQQPNWISQSREITELKQVDDFLNDIPRHAVESIIKRVESAYQASWDNAKKDKQRFKHPSWPKHENEISIELRGKNDGTKIVKRGTRNTFIQVAGCTRNIGWLAVREHRLIPEGSEIRQVNINKQADGWYCSIVLANPPAEVIRPAKQAIIGVDLGCIHTGNTQRVAVTSDGRIYIQHDGLKAATKRLATYQRLVSNRNVAENAKHADPLSKRTAKRRARIAKIHQRITRMRVYNQRYIAKRLSDIAETIVFEDLNHVGMRKKTRKGLSNNKRGLNRSLSTASPARLVEFTQQKAVSTNRIVVKVDPKYTSQVCSTCGDLGEKKSLSVRSWTCRACGTHHDRDVNAAINIMNRGING